MTIQPVEKSIEDHDLITLICAENEQAYATLYDRYADKMLGFAFNLLKNQTDAEDLIHDVLIEIWDKAYTYNESRGNVFGWLMLRVRSRCLDRFRKLKTLQKNTQIQVVDDHYEDDNQHFYEKHYQQSSIQNALELLSQKQRDVIEMSYYKGLTCAEISHYYGIPLGTVKTRLMSAMNLLRNFVGHTGVTQ